MQSLLSNHAPRDCVAFGPEGERTASDLLRDAARIAAALPAHVGPGAELLLVFREDRYAFAAALLAAWARGCTAVLPPDTGRETVLALLSRKTTSLALHDTLSGAPLRVDRLLAEGAEGPPLDLAVLRQEPLRVLCFRAGSIGEEDAVEKTGAQLAVEVEALLRAFPRAPAGRVISTITPGHHYGFLFGVLMPLFSGGALARTIGTPERLAESLGAQQHVLVSAPRHLAQLLQTAPALVERARWVVSSLTCLREGPARGLRERCATPVTDVFLSTETGCIAAREAPEQHAFRPLADVALDVRDGALFVRSPWSGSAATTPTSDRVSEAPEGGFVYEGRVEGHLGLRVQGGALQALEACIAALPEVEDVAVTFAPRAEAPKLLVAAVGSGLRAEGVAEAVAANLPREWALERVLILDSLGRDASGKLPHARLLRHFGLRADGTPVNYQLQFAQAEGHQDARGTHRVYTVQVPEDYGYFEGHFPGYPILPGAAQLSELLLPCVRRARPELGAPKQLSRLKFLGRIQPGETVEVVLSYRPDEPALEFVLRRGETLCAAGHASFERGEQAG